MPPPVASAVPPGAPSPGAPPPPPGAPHPAPGSSPPGASPPASVPGAPRARRAARAWRAASRSRAWRRAHRDARRRGARAAVVPRRRVSSSSIRSRRARRSTSTTRRAGPSARRPGRARSSLKPVRASSSRSKGFKPEERSVTPQARQARRHLHRAVRGALPRLDRGHVERRRRADLHRPQGHRRDRSHAVHVPPQAAPAHHLHGEAGLAVAAEKDDRRQASGTATQYNWPMETSNTGWINVAGREAPGARLTVDGKLWRARRRVAPRCSRAGARSSSRRPAWRTTRARSRSGARPRRRSTSSSSGAPAQDARDLDGRGRRSSSSVRAPTWATSRRRRRTGSTATSRRGLAVDNNDPRASCAASSRRSAPTSCTASGALIAISAVATFLSSRARTARARRRSEVARPRADAGDRRRRPRGVGEVLDARAGIKRGVRLDRRRVRSGRSPRPGRGGRRAPVATGATSMRSSRNTARARRGRPSHFPTTNATSAASSRRCRGRRPIRRGQLRRVGGEHRAALALVNVDAKGQPHGQTVIAPVFDASAGGAHGARDGDGRGAGRQSGPAGRARRQRRGRHVPRRRSGRRFTIAAAARSPRPPLRRGSGSARRRGQASGR